MSDTRVNASQKQISLSRKKPVETHGLFNNSIRLKDEPASAFKHFTEAVAVSDTRVNASHHFKMLAF